VRLSFDTCTFFDANSHAIHRLYTLLSRLVHVFLKDTDRPTHRPTDRPTNHNTDQLTGTYKLDNTYASKRQAHTYDSSARVRGTTKLNTPATLAADSQPHTPLLHAVSNSHYSTALYLQRAPH
jgi:hypothetical protein